MTITIQKDGKTVVLLTMPEPTAGLSFVRAVPAEPDDIRAAFAQLEQRPPSSLRTLRANFEEVAEIAAKQEASLAEVRDLLQPLYHQARMGTCDCEGCRRLVAWFDNGAGRDFLEELRGMHLAIEDTLATMLEWRTRASSRAEGLDVIRRLARAVGKTVRVD